jgi:hypothetical protein
LGKIASSYFKLVKEWKRSNYSYEMKGTPQRQNKSVDLTVNSVGRQLFGGTISSLVQAWWDYSWPNDSMKPTGAFTMDVGKEKPGFNQLDPPAQPNPCACDEKERWKAGMVKPEINRKTVAPADQKLGDKWFRPILWHWGVLTLDTGPIQI